MQHIDEATKGLGIRIIEDFQKAELDEAGRLSRFASRVGNAMLSPFSASARGKAKQTKAVSFLMDKFKEFARGRPYTPQLLYQYLSGTFGQPIADTIMKSGNGNPPPPSSNNDNEADPEPQNLTNPTAAANSPARNTDATPAATSVPSQIPGTPEQKAQTLMKQPATMPKPAGANATRSQILTQIVQQEQAKNPDQKQIMLLVNQLMQLGASKGKNSPEYQQMLKDVADMKTSLVKIVPEIKQIPTPESFISRRRRIR